MANSRTGGGISRLRVALECLRTISQDMTVSIAISLLQVAAFEGRSLREYSDMLGLAQSTMSRHLLDLGIMRRDRSPGLGLIDQRQDKDDLRKNIYCLSDRGRKLVHDLEAALRQGRVR
jgi:DNA-binding MarR family transcriptional regulator